MGLATYFLRSLGKENKFSFLSFDLKIKKKREKAEAFSLCVNVELVEVWLRIFWIRNFYHRTKFYVYLY